MTKSVYQGRPTCKECKNMGINRRKMTYEDLLQLFGDRRYCAKCNGLYLQKLLKHNRLKIRKK